MRALIFWAFVSLFPIYWTVTTSFKSAVDVTQGHLIPWLDFQPDWKGWRSLGLSPDTIVADLDGARRVPDALHEQRHRRRSAPRCWRSSSARSPPTACSRFEYKFGWMAQQGHLVLLPVAADPAAGRAGAAVPRPLQGAGAARHAHRPDPALHADGAADRHLDHARPVRHHPDRARARRRWSTAARSGARSSASSCRSRCRAWSRPSSSRWCCAGTSISSPRC